MVTLKLIFKPGIDQNGMSITKLTHIKVLKDGKYEKFAKHTQSILEYIQNVDIKAIEEVIK